MKISGQILFLMVWLVMMAAPPLSVAASQQKKQLAQKELDQLKKNIDKLQANLNSTQKQKSVAVTQLKDAEKKIATASKILNSTKRQLRDKEKQLSRSKDQQRNLQVHKKEQKQALAQQIKSAFISGRQEYLKMLLNQEDPEALGRMLVFFDYMNKARTKKVEQLQQTLIDLENIDKVVQTEIKQLNVLKDAKEQETQRLKKLTDQRKQLVRKLAEEIAAKSEQLTELQVNAAELQSLIDSVVEAIEKIDFTQPLDGLKAVKGKLRWPTRGKHTKRYGSNMSAGMKSTGVLINADEGNTVNAVHYGRVVFADWLRGFGLLLILDHGEGYMSLYGYNQALYKQVGDWVDSGEAISTVGQSGGQAKSGLYFEMRHQGQPFNPGPWFR